MIGWLISIAFLITGIFTVDTIIKICLMAIAGLFAIAGSISFGVDKLNAKLQKILAVFALYVDEHK